MKVVILAGGYGTRLQEETQRIPKPMVEIGGKPVLWHIMKIYSYYGFNDFIICLGYKGDLIKKYFLDYSFSNSDITVNTHSGVLDIHERFCENWNVTLVDTGLNSYTGERLSRIEHYITDTEFMLTYGDGVSDVNINDLISFHKKHGKYATCTAIKKESRFGILDIEDDSKNIKKFDEKPFTKDSWINGGFFVLNKEIFDYLGSGMLESSLFPKLADNNQMMAYTHYGFWKAMDTLRDKNELEDLWLSGTAKWAVWDKN